MRRLLMIIAIIMLMSSLSADPWSGVQSNDSLKISAYKNVPLSAFLDFECIVTNAKTSDAVEWLSETHYSIGKNDFVSGTKFENALTISVGTNSRNPRTVSVLFSRFDAEDPLTAPTPYYSARWKSAGSSSDWIDHYISTGDQDSGHIEGQSYNFVDGQGNRYRYKLNVASDTDDVTVSAGSGAQVTLTFSPVAQIYSNSDWEDISPIPGSGDVLPGFYVDSENDKVRGSITFDLYLVGILFKDLPANTRYICSVRVTVEGV